MSKRFPFSVSISLIVILLSSSTVFAPSANGLEQITIQVVDVTPELNVIMGVMNIKIPHFAQ